MTKEISGARYLAEALAHIGVTNIFFMDAVLRHTLRELKHLGVRRVLAHTEKGAAYMADGYARASGRLGVCAAQSVGAANLASGLQDAYLHRAPILALTGRREPMFCNRNAYQEIDHTALFQPMTKYQGDVAVGDELPLLLAQAIQAATDGSPGPVHLDLNGIQAQIIEAEALTDPVMPDAALARIPVRRPLADPEEIARAAEQIAAASRPILVVGTGAIQSGAHTEISAFVDALSMPIATSLGGRGIIDTLHSMHVGVVGTYSFPVTNRIVHDADLVIYLGCHASDQVTNNYLVPHQSTPIVQIDVDGLQIGKNYMNTIGVKGDPTTVLKDLSARLVGKTPDWSDWAETAKDRVTAWRADVASSLASDATPISVPRLLAEINKALPSDGILVTDTGYSGIWTGTMVDIAPPQLYLRAAGSLGWAFPASLGAQLSTPKRKVICFTGDGGFYYHLPELETARRLNIPTVTVVNNNSGFGQGIFNVRKIYEGTDASPDETNRFGPTDFAAVARSFGIEGIRVEDPAEIAPALERALAMDGPVLIDVVTHDEDRAPEAWSPEG